MGFSKTPYEMQREQQERAIKAQEQAAGRQAAMQAWSALADMDTVTPEAPLAPTHDWQHSADTGAKRAAAMELQTLEGKQKREQIADKAAQDRMSTAYEYSVKAAYRPKVVSGGSGYPSSKLINEFWKTHETIPNDKDQERRLNQHKEYILSQLRRQGSNARREADVIENTVRQGGSLYDYQSQNKAALRQQELGAKGEVASAASEARATKAEDDRRLRADIALVNSLEEKGGIILTKEERAAREGALKRLQGYSQQPQTSTERAAAPATQLPAKTPEPEPKLETRVIKGVEYKYNPANGKYYK